MHQITVHYGLPNTFCFVECSPGHFGMNCSELCSGHCVDEESCDHISGVCHRGCQDGFVGRLCNNCKTMLMSS